MKNSKNLIILPSGTNNRPKIKKRIQLMNKIFKIEQNIFYFDYSNDEKVNDLKKMLINKNFEIIVFETPSLEMSRILRIVKSLSSKSKIIIDCPNLDFVKKASEKCNIMDDVHEWYQDARTIQTNIYQQADLVIVESKEDKKLLQQEIKNLPILDFKQLQEKKIVIPEKKQKKISIIILTFNQLSDTKHCVESLKKYTDLPYELIFVDNGSTDRTVKYLQSIKDAKIITNSANLGFAIANNQGIRVANGDYILLLNNDVLLTENWLEKLVVCAESNPLIGLVGPCTNHAVGQQVIDMPLDINDLNIQKFAWAQSIKNAGYWIETHRIIGFCMLIKKEVIEKVGLLDERFGPGGFEDYDFCLRVKQRGYKIMIANDVFIYHIGGQGYFKNNLDYGKLRRQNLQIFIEKWCKKVLEIMETMPDK